MMRHRRSVLRLALLGSDYAVSLLAALVAAAVRFGPDWARQAGFALPPRPELLLPAYGLGVVAMFWSAGLYELRTRWSWLTELRVIVRAIAVTAVVTLGVLYLLDLRDISRIVVGLYFLLLGAGVAGARLAVRLLFRALRGRGRGLRHLLVVGSGPAAQRLVSRMTRHPEYGVCVVGFVDDAPTGSGGYRWLGSLDALSKVLADEVVDEVAICLPWDQWPTIGLLARLCEEQGKIVRIPVNTADHAIAKGRLETLDGLPVLSLVTGPDQILALGVKRSIDIVGATLMLIVTAPALIAVAAAIVATDGFPVLFKQPRGGLHGREFKAWKFRSMVCDAEARKAGLMTQNERVGPAFKLGEDPRVTPVGRWLRKTSVDELPQLWNVLKGDMSLVGPRPQPVAEVRAYDLWHRRRLSVRPGLTGLWQVTARGEAEFDRWVELDLRYIDTWSVWSDIKLLAKTPIALIRTPGN